MSPSNSTSTYDPIFTPSVPYLHHSINPTTSTHTAHFRRLYDIYHVALQRRNVGQAKRAYALLVRCKEFDWATNWRSGIDMVELPPNADDGDDEGGEGGREQDDDVSGSSSTVDDRGEGRQEEGRHRKSRALVDLQVRYLKEVHAVHSRKALKKHSLREPEAVLLELILLYIKHHRYREALSELELYLPNYPYRDSISLHEYAGLLSLFLAQEERDASRRLEAQRLSRQQALADSPPFSLFGGTQLPSRSQQSSQPTRSRNRSRSSSTASSTSRSSAGGGRLEARSKSGKPRERTPTEDQKRPGKRGRTASSLSHAPPTHATVQRLCRDYPIYAQEARAFFNRAVDIENTAAATGTEDDAEQRTARVARQYLDLMDGVPPSAGGLSTKASAWSRVDSDDDSDSDDTTSDGNDDQDEADHDAGSSITGVSSDYLEDEQVSATDAQTPGSDFSHDPEGQTPGQERGSAPPPETLPQTRSERAMSLD